MTSSWLKSKLPRSNKALAPGGLQVVQTSTVDPKDQFGLHVLFDATKEVGVPSSDQSDPGSDVCYEDVEYVCSLRTV